MLLPNEEREALANGQGKLAKCPFCECEKDEGHEKCFHCIACGYLQCCDYNGFYNEYADKHRGKTNESND